MSNPKPKHLPRGPYKRGGETGPNTRPSRERGQFAASARARREFLRAYRRCGEVTTAAYSIGVVPETVYNYKRANPAFALLMEKVRRRFRLGIEDEVYRRGVEGVVEPLVTGKGVVLDEEKNPVHVRKYSDRMLELLAKRSIPAYTDKVELEGTLGLAVGLTGLEGLKKLTPSARAKLREVLAELGGGEEDAETEEGEPRG